MRAPPMVPEYDPRAPWIPHPQQVQPGQIGGYPPNSHNNCGPPRGFNNKNNNRGNPYAGRDLETRLSDRYRPDTPWSVRERTILVGPVLNDVVAEQLAGVLIRRLGPVDSVRIADGVARVMFDYTHAELARRVCELQVKVSG